MQCSPSELCLRDKNIHILINNNNKIIAFFEASFPKRTFLIEINVNLSSLFLYLNLLIKLSYNFIFDKIPIFF
jgi:hypothetical protein